MMSVEKVTNEECGVGLILDAILEAVHEEFAAGGPPVSIIE